MKLRATTLTILAAAVGLATMPATSAAGPPVPARPASPAGAPLAADPSADSVPSWRKEARAQKTEVLPSVIDVVNAGFETGTLLNWQFDEGSADVVVVPKNPPDACFQPSMPSEGNFMACMSTGSFYGGESNGGVRTDLTSGPISFDFKPGQIKISFDVDFQTEEDRMSIGHNDAFEARLVTAAGTFPIIQLDTFGRTEPGRGLKVEGFTELLGTNPGCSLVGIRTGLLHVTWSKPFDSVMRTLIARGPVFLEFSVTNQGDDTHTSIACVDDVEIRVTKP